MSEKRTRTWAFFLAHAATGCCYSISGVYLFDRYDGAIGRSASLWLSLFFFFAFAVIGALAWRATVELVLRFGRFRGPNLLSALLSGVASTLTLIWFPRDGSDLLGLLGLCLLVPAGLGTVWTVLSFVRLAPARSDS